MSSRKSVSRGVLIITLNCTVSTFPLSSVTSLVLLFQFVCYIHLNHFNFKPVLAIICNETKQFFTTTEQFYLLEFADVLSKDDDLVLLNGFWDCDLDMVVPGHLDDIQDVGDVLLTPVVNLPT